MFAMVPTAPECSSAATIELVAARTVMRNAETARAAMARHLRLCGGVGEEACRAAMAGGEIPYEESTLVRGDNPTSRDLVWI